MGFSATRKKKGWCIEHPVTGTVFIFRPYRSNELVYAPDLFLVRSQLDARGMVAEDEFDESLTKTPVWAGSKTMNDSIVDEVRRIKEELAARFNYDLKAIYEHLKQREKEREEKTGCKFVSYPPRRVEPPADEPSKSRATPVVADLLGREGTPAHKH